MTSFVSIHFIICVFRYGSVLPRVIQFRILMGSKNAHEMNSLQEMKQCTCNVFFFSDLPSMVLCLRWYYCNDHCLHRLWRNRSWNVAVRVRAPFRSVFGSFFTTRVSSLYKLSITPRELKRCPSTFLVMFKGDIAQALAKYIKIPSGIFFEWKHLTLSSQAIVGCDSELGYEAHVYHWGLGGGMFYLDLHPLHSICTLHVLLFLCQWRWARRVFRGSLHL